MYAKITRLHTIYRVRVALYSPYLISHISDCLSPGDALHPAGCARPRCPGGCGRVNRSGVIRRFTAATIQSGPEHTHTGFIQRVWDQFQWFFFFRYIYMKSSDAKASKCHLKFSSKMSIFLRLSSCVYSKKYWVVSTQLWVRYGLTQLLGQKLNVKI